jgi:two-component system phosphate regulon sensor histidine kinase PhoR
MPNLGLRFFYFLIVLMLVSFLWAELISWQTMPYFLIGVLIVAYYFQLWNINRLHDLLLKDDLIGRKRGLGLWREIYGLLEKKSKVLHQEISAAADQYDRFIQGVQASPNGLIMLDKMDRIKWCNKICREHFRIDPVRDTNQPVAFLLRHPDFVQYMQEANFSMPLQLDHMGERGHVMLRLQIIPYGESQKLLLSQDITAIKKNEAIRQDFVANVSHELRTPLTIMSGFLETIRDLPLSEEEKARYLEIMVTQSDRMLTLVDELLILTRLDSSPVSPKTRMVNLAEVFERLMLDARSLSKGRHILTLRVSSQKYILGSDSEIISAFGNLVNNAIRYSPEGGEILIDWSDLPVGGARFAVTDSGLGIAPEHIPRITERFYRVDLSRSRDTGGTGLGLAIVKHVALRHQAELRIESQIGQGSTFEIIFIKDRLVDGALNISE